MYFSLKYYFCSQYPSLRELLLQFECQRQNSILKLIHGSPKYK